MDNVQDVGIDELIASCMETYGAYVLTERQIPDFRDGLKPVQRRIIWTMYEEGHRWNSRFIKCAAVVGNTIARYHPHGDCLWGDAQVYSLEYNKLFSIENLLDTPELWTLALDKHSGQLVPTKAHSFRIGQWADTIYKITLSDGSAFYSTANHPYYLEQQGYTKTEDISAGDLVLGGSLYLGKRPLVGLSNAKTRRSMSYIVGEWKYRDTPERLRDELGRRVDLHHKNENTENNIPDNIQIMSQTKHMRHHGLSEKRVEAWVNLAIANSKVSWFVKAARIINHIKELDKKPTPELYEKYRTLVYKGGGTCLTTVNAKGVSFEKLVSMSRNSDPKFSKKIHRFSTRRMPYWYAFKQILNIMKKSGHPLSWEGYDKARQEVRKNVPTKYDKQGHCVPIKQFPLAKSLKSCTPNGKFIEVLRKLDPDAGIVVTKIEKLVYSKPIPMYDFTVDKYHNMIIANKAKNNRATFIVAHNSSVYDAMVNMSGLPLKSNKKVFWGPNAPYPFVEMYGNMGSIDGDPPAAMRYPEARLSHLAQYLFNLQPVTQMTDNYLNNRKEPLFLPSSIPALLLNGVSGIAVGTSTDIPPHNLKDVTRLLKKWFTNDKPMTLGSMVRTLKGPDWSYGGVVYNNEKSDINAMYKNGKGSIQWGIDAVVEQKGSRYCVVITGLNLAKFLERLSKKKEVRGIKKEEISDSIRIVVETTSEKVAEDIVNSKIPVTYNWNIVERIAEDNIKFRHITLMDYMDMWCSYILTTHTKFFLKEGKRVLKEMRYLQLRLKVIEHSQEVVECIKKNKLDRLKKLLSTDDEGVKLIVAMSLGSLSKGSRKTILKGYKAKEEEVIRIKYNMKNLKPFLVDFFTEVGLSSRDRKTKILK